MATSSGNWATLTEPSGFIGGPGGAPLPTFTLTTNGAGGPDLGYPWFSHQHDPEFAYRGKLVNGKRIFTIFDDGNTRQAFYNQNANSRCQELYTRRDEFDRQSEHQW